MVIPLDTEYLKEVLMKDKEKLMMLWANVSPRQIIIKHKEIPEIEAMNREKIKNLCLMCKHKMYQPGDEVDLRSGGILLRGGLKHKVKDRKVQDINKKLNKSNMIDKLKDREMLGLTNRQSIMEDRDDYLD